MESLSRLKEGLIVEVKHRRFQPIRALSEGTTRYMDLLSWPSSISCTEIRGTIPPFSVPFDRRQQPNLPVPPPHTPHSAYSSTHEESPSIPFHPHSEALATAHSSLTKFFPLSFIPYSRNLNRQLLIHTQNPPVSPTYRDQVTLPTD